MIYPLHHSSSFPYPLFITISTGLIPFSYMNTKPQYPHSLFPYSPSLPLVPTSGNDIFCTPSIFKNVF
jgi:hypothetical protein